MAQAAIGRRGKNLAIRLPAEAAKTAGLGEGERVEIRVVGRGSDRSQAPGGIGRRVDVFRQVSKGTGERFTALPMIGVRIRAASASRNERDGVPASRRKTSVIAGKR